MNASISNTLAYILQDDNVTLESALILGINSQENSALSFQLITHSGKMFENVGIERVFSEPSLPEDYVVKTPAQLQFRANPSDEVLVAVNPALSKASAIVVMPGTKDKISARYAFSATYMVPQYANDDIRLVHGFWTDWGNILVLPNSQVKSWQISAFNGTPNRIQEIHQAEASFRTPSK